MSLLRMLGFCVLAMLAAFGGLPAHAQEDSVWNEQLRPHYFGDRTIVESDSVVLHAPERAEDAAMVPIRVETRPPEGGAHVETLTLFADANPVPLIGVFHFGAENGSADLALNIRVDGYGPVRAIAETSDGKLYMSRRFVKASGGCSAPAGTDLKAAEREMGKMRLRLSKVSPIDTAMPVQLSIRHPNTTGLQRDQITQLQIPARFIRELRVELDGKQVFAAETDISVSENPMFRFSIPPAKAGILSVVAVDSKGTRFEHQEPIDADSPYQVESAG